MSRSDLPALIRELVREVISHPDLYAGKRLHSLIMEGVEKVLIEKTLDETKGNKKKAAEVLGINRNTLSSKIKRYGLDSGER